jgi:hypothetical protein
VGFCAAEQTLSRDVKRSAGNASWPVKLFSHQRESHFSVIARVIVVVLLLVLAGLIFYIVIYPNLRRDGK